MLALERQERDASAPLLQEVEKHGKDLVQKKKSLARRKKLLMEWKAAAVRRREGLHSGISVLCGRFFAGTTQFVLGVIRSIRRSRSCSVWS